MASIAAAIFVGTLLGVLALLFVSFAGQGDEDTGRILERAVMRDLTETDPDDMPAIMRLQKRARILMNQREEGEHGKDYSAT
jgi:hypothetical protein